MGERRTLQSLGKEVPDSCSHTSQSTQRFNKSNRKRRRSEKQELQELQQSRSTLKGSKRCRQFKPKEADAPVLTSVEISRRDRNAVFLCENPENGDVQSIHVVEADRGTVVDPVNALDVVFDCSGSSEGASGCENTAFREDCRVSVPSLFRAMRTEW